MSHEGFSHNARYSAELTETMQTKCLAQGRSIRLYPCLHTIEGMMLCPNTNISLPCSWFYVNMYSASTEAPKCFLDSWLCEPLFMTYILRIEKRFTTATSIKTCHYCMRRHAPCKYLCSNTLLWCLEFMELMVLVSNVKVNSTTIPWLRCCFS